MGGERGTRASELIRRELAKPKYADLASSKDWDALADALNAPTETMRDSVPRDVLQNALMQVPFGDTTLWFALRQIARNASHPANALADAVVHVVQESLLKSVNLDNPGVRRMIAQLRAAGFLTEEQEAAILALGDYPVSPAELLGLGKVTPLDVANAMAEVD